MIHGFEIEQEFFKEDGKGFVKFRARDGHKKYGFICEAQDLLDAIEAFQEDVLCPMLMGEEPETMLLVCEGADYPRYKVREMSGNDDERTLTEEELRDLIITRDDIMESYERS